MNAQTLIALFAALVALAALGLVYRHCIAFDAAAIEVMKKELESLKGHSHNVAGPQGKTGERGPRGPKGEKGDPFPPEELKQIKAELFKTRRSDSGVSTDVKGGLSWGVWKEPTYCPDNHYACGVSQKVEGSQGRGDDTAVNDLRLFCCEF